MAADAPAAADTLDVYSSHRSPLWTAMPRLWRAVITPLGQAVIYAEHEELPQRVQRWFTNEAETFALFPYAQLGGETGTGVGLSTYHTALPGPGRELEGTAIFAAPGRYSGQLAVSDPNIEGSRWYSRLAAALLETDAENATANGSLKPVLEALEDALADGDEDERLMASRELRLDWAVGWRPHAYALEEYRSNLYLEARLRLARLELDTGGAPLLLPGVGETAAAAARPGRDHRLKTVSVGGRVLYDSRDYRRPRQQLTLPPNYAIPGRLLLRAGERYFSFRDTAYAERGGLIQAEADLVTGDQDVRYLRLGAELQRFVTLFWPDRVLALRARLDKAHRLSDDDVIPYLDMPTLGGGQRLRGYERGRFRGEGALLLTLEYRYPIWDTWNAYLFWDEGQVFDTLDDIERDALRTSVGGGISVRTEQAFLVGVRAGHSRDHEVLLGLSLEKEF